MKEKDLVVDFKDHQVILFAEKNDDTIGPLQTGSYVAHHYISEFFQIMEKLNNSLQHKLIQGEISPVFMYMTLEELTLSELALRVGLPKWKVKRHLRYEYFHKMRISELKRYAEVFNIPLANMFQIVATRQDHKWRMGFQKEVENAKPVIITQEKTKNPYLVITKAEQNKP
jgi:hypothetical protein